MDTSALEALASMARVLRALAFERHPIVDRPVCCIELDGDAVLFDEAEIRTAADHALQVVISTELQKFGHLTDIRLDAVCRLHLESSAALLPTRWSIRPISREDRKSTRRNSSHKCASRRPAAARKT